MWKNVKNFFKWVADCTGISWILGKISSCWKSCWSHSQEEDFVIINMPEPTNEPSPVKPGPKHESVIGSICENTRGVLELFVTINHTGKVFGGGVGIANDIELDSTKILDKLEYCAYVKCDGGIFKITCDKLIKDNNNNGALLSIKSVASQDGQTSSSELEGMKNMLGLKKDKPSVIITHTNSHK